MSSTFRQIASLLILGVFTSCAPNKSVPVRAEIKTSEGIILIELSDITPLHRDNFIRLAESGFYEGVSFHRVIKGFVIQAGDPLTRTAPLPSFRDYSVTAEINDSLFHKRGVIAAAREGDDVNPARNSSGTQFYIVQGKTYTDDELQKTEQRVDYNIRHGIYYNALQEARQDALKDSLPLNEDEIQQNAAIKFSDITGSSGPYKTSSVRRTVYQSIGGAPFLDYGYTVFGEVIEGMDVVDAIGDTSTDSNDKPYKDIKIIKIKIIR